MKPEAIHVGDFVYCRSQHYRDQLQIERELALVIETKRNNFKVLFANDKRVWLPGETLAKMLPRQLDYGTFLEKVYYIIRKVHAMECEIVNGGPEHFLSLQIDEMSHETVDDLRGFLAESFVSLVLVPEGMAFMRIEISFRNLSWQQTEV